MGWNEVGEGRAGQERRGEGAKREVVVVDVSVSAVHVRVGECGKVERGGRVFRVSSLSNVLKGAECRRRLFQLFFLVFQYIYIIFFS